MGAVRRLYGRVSKCRVEGRIAECDGHTRNGRGVTTCMPRQTWMEGPDPPVAKKPRRRKSKSIYIRNGQVDADETMVVGAMDVVPIILYGKRSAMAAAWNLYGFSGKAKLLVRIAIAIGCVMIRGYHRSGSDTLRMHGSRTHHVRSAKRTVRNWTEHERQSERTLNEPGTLPAGVVWDSYERENRSTSNKRGRDPTTPIIIYRAPSGQRPRHGSSRSGVRAAGNCQEIGLGSGTAAMDGRIALPVPCQATLFLVWAQRSQSDLEY